MAPSRLPVIARGGRDAVTDSGHGPLRPSQGPVELPKGGRNTVRDARSEEICARHQLGPLTARSAHSPRAVPPAQAPEAPRALQSSRERARWFTASDKQPFLRPSRRKRHGDVPRAPESLQGEEATGQTGNGVQDLGVSPSPRGAQTSEQSVPHQAPHPYPPPATAEARAAAAALRLPALGATPSFPVSVSPGSSPRKCFIT